MTYIFRGVRVRIKEFANIMVSSRNIRPGSVGEAGALVGDRVSSGRVQSPDTPRRRPEPCQTEHPGLSWIHLAASLTHQYIRYPTVCKRNCCLRFYYSFLVSKCYKYNYALRVHEKKRIEIK